MAKKEFKDIKTAIELDANETKMWFSDFMILCINTPPEGGFKADEMRTRLAIIDAIKEGKEKSMNFPDDHVRVIKKAVETYSWLQMHKDILAFLDAVEKM
jgi:hypothetical protein